MFCLHCDADLVGPDGCDCREGSKSELIAGLDGATNMQVHFSSKTDLHATPQDFFDKLNREFNFKLDVCATQDNVKCERYFTEEQDGLQQTWNGVCWMNPPYGRTIKSWMAKAYASAVEAGATVVCLVPARTDTAWWHDYAMKGEIRFIRGRLKFGDAQNNAPFPSAVVIFRPDCGSKSAL